MSMRSTRSGSGAILALFGLLLCAGAEAAPPKLLGSDGADLERARDAYRSGDGPVKATVDDIVKEADKALQRGPFTVVKKPKLPPSGDKHDYVSLSPYWWPDPSKPDGIPYVRRDGQFNPERADYDLAPMDQMTEDVESLARAYYFTGDEKYADHAALLLRTWFIDPATRMNPNMKYAQFVPGYDEPRASGLIESNRFRRVTDAVPLLAGSKAWSKEDDAALRSWFGELTDYFLNSPQGQAERVQTNNHGTWYAVQVGTFALFAGKDDLAKEVVESSFKERINDQIAADGSQPEELTRTLTFHYHRFNLLALIELATLGEQLGLDLWGYTTPDGRGIRKALDFLVPYAVKDEPWPHKQISPMKHGDMVQLLRRSANAYGDAGYELAARRVQEIDPRPVVDLLYPPAVAPAAKADAK